MYQIVKCPKHCKDLVFFKKTLTHSLFKCPDCNYIDLEGVVHRDLPEKYIQLQVENRRLKAKIISAICYVNLHKFQEAQTVLEEALKGIK